MAMKSSGKKPVNSIKLPKPPKEKVYTIMPVKPGTGKKNGNKPKRIGM